MGMQVLKWRKERLAERTNQQRQHQLESKKINESSSNHNRKMKKSPQFGDVIPSKIFAYTYVFYNFKNFKNLRALRNERSYICSQQDDEMDRLDQAPRLYPVNHSIRYSYSYYLNFHKAPAKQNTTGKVTYCPVQ